MIKINHHKFSLSLIILFLFILREQGMEGEREGEIHQCVRETSAGCLPYVLLLGNEWSATLVCALTGNRTGDLFLFEMMPDQLSYPGQGIILVWNLVYYLGAEKSEINQEKLIK